MPLLCWPACFLGSYALIALSKDLRAFYNSHLISKIYFPRLIIPTAQIAVNFVDFIIGVAFLFIFCLFVQPIDFITVLSLPLFIVLALMFCEGGSLWLSALTVRYKDFRFLVPFAIQIGMFISPVGYSSNLISKKWIWLYCLNPLVGIIDGFRWAFFGESSAHFVYSVSVSVVITLFLLISGFFYFRKMEDLLSIGCKCQNPALLK